MQNYDTKFVYFVDMRNVNGADVCVHPLLGLTASQKQLHCWQSMSKTYLSMSAFDVFSNAENSARCAQQIHKTFSQKHTQNVTSQMSLSISITIAYCYRFKILPFSTEMKDGPKQNYVLLHWIFALPMRVIYREKLLKAPLYLSPSRTDVTGCADRTLSRWHPAVYKNTHINT